MEHIEDTEIKDDLDNTSGILSTSNPNLPDEESGVVIVRGSPIQSCSESSPTDSDTSGTRDDKDSSSLDGRKTEEHEEYNKVSDESQLSRMAYSSSSSLHSVRSEASTVPSCISTLSLAGDEDDEDNDDHEAVENEANSDSEISNYSSNNSSTILEFSSGSSIFSPQSTGSPIVRHVKNFRGRQGNQNGSLWTASGRPRSPPKYDISKQEFTLPPPLPPQSLPSPFQPLLPDYLASADNRNDSMLSMTKNEILVPGFIVETKKAAMFLLALVLSVAMICYFAPNIFRTQVYRNPVAVTNVYQDIWKPNPKDLAFLSSQNSTKSLVDAKILHHLRLIQEKQDLYRTSFQIQLDQSAMMLEKLGSHFRSLESAYVKLAEVKKMESKVDLLDNSMRMVQQAIDGKPVGTSQIVTKKGYWFNTVTATMTLTTVSVSTKAYSTKTMTVTETQMSNPPLTALQASNGKDCLNQNSIMSELEHQYKMKNRQIEDFIYYSNREFSKLLQNGLRQSCGDGGVGGGCTNGKFNEKQIDQLAELFAMRFQRNLEPHISTVVKKMNELQTTNALLSQRIDRIYGGDSRNKRETRDIIKPAFPPDLLPARDLMEAAENWIFGKGAGYDVPDWWTPDEMKRNTRFLIGLLCHEEFEGKQGEFNQDNLKGRFGNCFQRRRHLQRQRGILAFLPWRWASTKIMKGLLALEELQGISFSGSLGWTLLLCATIFANAALNIFLIWLWNRYNIGGKIVRLCLFIRKLITNPGFGFLRRLWLFLSTIAGKSLASLKALVFAGLAVLCGFSYITISKLYKWTKRLANLVLYHVLKLARSCYFAICKMFLFIIGPIFWFTYIRSIWATLPKITINPLKWRMFSRGTAANSKLSASSFHIWPPSFNPFWRKETAKRVGTKTISNSTDQKHVSPETEEVTPKSSIKIDDKVEAAAAHTPNASDLLAQKGKLKKKTENTPPTNHITRNESNPNVDDRSIDKKGLINKWDKTLASSMEKKGSAEKEVPPWLAELKKNTSAKKKAGMDGTSPPPAKDDQGFSNTTTLSPSKSQQETPPLQAKPPQPQVSVCSEVDQVQTSSSSSVTQPSTTDTAETVTAGGHPKKTLRNVEIEEVEEGDDQFDS